MIYQVLHDFLSLLRMLALLCQRETFHCLTFHIHSVTTTEVHLNLVKPRTIVRLVSKAESTLKGKP